MTVGHVSSLTVIEMYMYFKLKVIKSHAFYTHNVTTSGDRALRECVAPAVNSSLCGNAPVVNNMCAVPGSF